MPPCEKRLHKLARGTGTASATRPLAAGLITSDLPELGEIISGARPGRTSPDQITLYKSVGVAVQDAAAVGLVLQNVDM